jgi:hypothetical protein
MRPLCILEYGKYYRKINHCVITLLIEFCGQLQLARVLSGSFNEGYGNL